MPRSLVGKVTPQSMRTIPSASSSARQFIPISPRPPRATRRRVFGPGRGGLGDGGGLSTFSKVQASFLGTGAYSDRPVVSEAEKRRALPGRGGRARGFRRMLGASSQSPPLLPGDRVIL